MYTDSEVTCKICGKHYERSCHFKHHLEWVHHLDPKTYYDTHVEPGIVQ